MTIADNSYANVLRQLHATLGVVPPASYVPVQPPMPVPPSMTGDTLVLGSSPNAATLRSGYQNLLSQFSTVLHQPAVVAPAVVPPPAVEPPKAEPPKPEAPKPEAPKPEPPKPEAKKEEPAKAEAPKPAPPAPAPAPTYTVQSGDSLSRIAQRALGDGNRWRELFDLNRDQISNPDVIHPGQVLKLPGGSSAPAPAAPPPPPPKPAPGPTYTVGSGDTLSGIASRTLGDGNRWREIFDLNRDQLSNPNVIQAGQVLKLPGGANAAAPAPRPASGRNDDRGAIYVQQPNGWTCGPTSLTMAAAAFGVRPANHATVNELVGKTRTSPAYGIPDNNAIPNAARQLGLQVAFHGRSSAASIREALNKGHGVILNGSISGGVGHFIYIAGLNADGTFKVFDPYRPAIKAWNDSQLHAFAYATGRGSISEIWR